MAKQCRCPSGTGHANAIKPDQNANALKN